MRNLNTRLKCRRRSADPMREYDRLPPALRGFLSEAALPWSAPSVKRAWEKALKRYNGCEAQALAALRRAEQRSLNKDAPRIWGASYPCEAAGALSRAAAR
ncbi:DUF6525 family protein [Aliiroseovarius sp.]|uniref:DUF6525 family protein n=1 Tax=Aliiroseovarius sp. TaxID=1872442 RepID=UPI003BACC539